jgi:hypothetical protein
MAHELNTTDGKVSFASTQKAWHGLGQIVDKAMTAEQAIELGGLNYEVVKTPLTTKVKGEQRLKVNEHFATVRTDTKQVLGVVGSRYQIVQNSDAFVFFDSIVGQGQAIFETAGALGQGERILLPPKCQPISALQIWMTLRRSMSFLPIAMTGAAQSLQR